ncbi:MAG: thioredoxin family protein [Eubacteriales bacterium]
MAERITHIEFDEKVRKFAGVAIVDFYSDSCIPCKRMSPVLAALEEEYGSEVYIAKVNVAYEKELTGEYGILSAPTFLIFKNGELVERISGVKKKEELEQLIEAYQ